MEQHVREEESSIAKVRNKIQPIVTYFLFRKILEEDKVAEEHIEFIALAVDELYIQIQSVYMDSLLEIIKDDNIW